MQPADDKWLIDRWWRRRQQHNEWWGMLTLGARDTWCLCVWPRPVDDCVLVVRFDSLEMNYVRLSRAVVHDTSNRRAVSVLVRVTDIQCWLNVRCCCCWFDGISATRVKACSLITRFTDTQLPASSWFFSRNLSPRSVTHRWRQCFWLFYSFIMFLG